MDLYDSLDICDKITDHIRVIFFAGIIYDLALNIPLFSF